MTEPKRLILDAAHTTLSLVDNDLDEAHRYANGEEPGGTDQVLWFRLADLQCITLGERCHFAKLLRPTYDTGQHELMDVPVPYDRLASFKFGEVGSLCVRFLSA